MKRVYRCRACGGAGHKAGSPRCPKHSAEMRALRAEQAREAEKHHLREFDSLGALLEQLAKPTLPQHGETACSTYKGEWTGDASRSEALAMLSGDGCPKLAEQVRAITLDMVPSAPPAPALAEAYDVSGGAVDVGRFLSGDPECMIDYSSPAGQVATRDLYVNLTCSGGVDASYTIRRGAAICAAIDLLERSRIKVRLYFVIRIGTDWSGSGSVTWTGLVKDYHAPLDIDLISFVFAHPAMFRHLGFRLMEQEPALAARVQDRSYGSVIEWNAPEGAAYIGSMHLLDFASYKLTPLELAKLVEKRILLGERD